MSTKAGASDHLYLFIYANYFIFHVFIEWIFSVCLFTYSNQCQQNHTQRPPVFVYLCKLLVVPCVFRLNINIYLFISSNRCQQKHALLFSYIYLGIRSRTGQGVHSNVITSFFNCSGLIRLNCSNIFFYIIFQYQICHKCCNIWSLTSVHGLWSSYWWRVRRCVQILLCLFPYFLNMFLVNPFCFSYGCIFFLSDVTFIP